MLLGQTLGNRYRFDVLIGEGTFANVYRITDLHRRATLAAKVLRRDIAQEPAFLERFKREAAVLSRLQHPHIVRYYDIVEFETETASYIFILMDYIPGETLETALQQREKPIKPLDSLTYLTPLASALHYAHNEHVIHRDLKPANILLHENGTLYITDFGIARILNRVSELTAGMTIGTPFYMAPEQIKGEPVTLATDIYTLGILLYEMYTGRVPFRGESGKAQGTTVAARITYEHIYLAPLPLAEINPDIDLAVAEVVLRCLEKDPDRRFHSIGELYDALTEAIGAPPVSLMPDVPDVKLPEWSQFVKPVSDTPVESEQPKTLSRIKIEHPAPTQPHLEKTWEESTPAAPTLSHMTSERRSPSDHPPRQPLHPRRSIMPRWMLAMLIAGLLLVLLALVVAVVYLMGAI